MGNTHNMKRYLLLGLLFCCSINYGRAQQKAPVPVGPIPTENQMRWQEMEYYAFIHFSLNTFTDQSWGFGNEDINLFNPKELDCRQWARICKEAGMKGVILTAKHHSGFCLWPSKYTAYSVKNAPWKNGKGDVVREMAEACQEFGLKLGIYVSPWDRNHPDYGKPEYITYFRNQLTELLTNYGPIFEVWFDGANGGSGYYGGANETRIIDRTTYYDWSNTYSMIRKIQPDIVIWNDGGDRGDLRWVGTEGGWVGETNWSLLNGKGEVDRNMLEHGLETGDSWVPAEVNTSIRPEWFYHPSEDSKVKSVATLLDTYYNSVGRNGTLLLNFPVMPNGLINARDEKAALETANEIKKAFAVNLGINKKVTASDTRGESNQFDASNAVDQNMNTFWATTDNVTQASLTVDFGEPMLFNRFLVQEYIRLGQRVKGFKVEVFVDGIWKEVAKATTIGYKRILRFPSVRSNQLRFTVTESKSCPVISNIGVYDARQILEPPTIIRDQSGTISISPSDKESTIYYTLDGNSPTTQSTRYVGPFHTDDGKIEVNAIAHDLQTGNSSPPSHEQFDISKVNWRILVGDDPAVYKILDGDIATTWHPGGDKKLPYDLIIDIGREQNVCGFRYYPDAVFWNMGVITTYELYTSPDNVRWVLADKGEFSNIKNNPVWQIKKFESRNARYIKLRALSNTTGDNNIGYAEVDILTK
jgi:alpha-L-fucosidase